MDSAASVSRSGLFARAALGLGAVSAGAAAARGLATAGAAAGSSRDHEVLQFALGLEELQAAFYAAALKSGKLSGEVHEFAQTVGGQERAHLHYVRKALGSGAGPTPKFNFADALRDQKSFVAAAVSLEDTGLAAYNGQATNLSPHVLAEVGRVMSVEARHSSWIRSLAGRQPAPVAVDIPITAAQAHSQLKQYMA